MLIGAQPQQAASKLRTPSVLQLLRFIDENVLPTDEASGGDGSGGEGSGEGDNRSEVSEAYDDDRSESEAPQREGIYGDGYTHMLVVGVHCSGF